LGVFPDCLEPGLAPEDDVRIASLGFGLKHVAASRDAGLANDRDMGTTFRRWLALVPSASESSTNSCTRFAATT